MVSCCIGCTRVKHDTAPYMVSVSLSLAGNGHNTKSGRWVCRGIVWDMALYVVGGSKLIIHGTKVDQLITYRRKCRRDGHTGIITKPSGVMPCTNRALL